MLWFPNLDVTQLYLCWNITNKWQHLISRCALFHSIGFSGGWKYFWFWQPLRCVQLLICQMVFIWLSSNQLQIDPIQCNHHLVLITRFLTWCIIHHHRIIAFGMAIMSSGTMPFLYLPPVYIQVEYIVAVSPGFTESKSFLTFLCINYFTGALPVAVR